MKYIMPKIRFFIFLSFSLSSYSSFAKEFNFTCLDANTESQERVEITFQNGERKNLQFRLLKDGPDKDRKTYESLSEVTLENVDITINSDSSLSISRPAEESEPETELAEIKADSNGAQFLIKEYVGLISIDDTTFDKVQNIIDGNTCISPTAFQSHENVLQVAQVKVQ